MARRREIYQGLQSAVGRYFYHYAREPESDIVVRFDDEEPYRPVIDWILEGKEPVVYAFFVWGVGGGRSSEWSYDYCKDRRITWNSTDKKWMVVESKKYILNGAENAPDIVRTEPEWPSD